MALPSKSSPIGYIVRLFTSLQLTIVCLMLGMVIIFWGTWAQKEVGIDEAVNTYFRSVLIWGSPFGMKAVIPIFPGGFLVGGVLLVNLIASHLYRFRLSWQKSGILITHFGIIILLLGELFTALFAHESAMRITEGQTKSYSESYHETELAIIDRSDPRIDKVVTVPESMLHNGTVIQEPHLPFRVEVRGFFANSQLLRRGPMMPADGTPVATQGIGTQVSAREIPPTSKSDERNAVCVWVELIGTEGSLGTWMVNSLFQEVQTVTYEGRTYSLELRLRRFYKPFALTLVKFTHDTYPGTDIPKNFSSRVRLVEPRRNEDREVLIYMNHPLRYDGLTFYQAGFEPGDTTTILQVVRNPSSVLPYVACVLVTLGLAIQFLMSLTRFNHRRQSSAAS